jgi:hypothetical protein
LLAAAFLTGRAALTAFFGVTGGFFDAARRVLAGAALARVDRVRAAGAGAGRLFRAAGFLAAVVRRVPAVAGRLFAARPDVPGGAAAFRAPARDEPDEVARPTRPRARVRALPAFRLAIARVLS